MANEVLLRETVSEIRANRKAWDQIDYCVGEYRDASVIADCGTTQCVAGFRCLMDGLKPTRNIWDDPNSVDGGFVDPTTGTLVSGHLWAIARFGLTGCEATALFAFMTDDVAELEERVEEIIAGKWR